MRTTHHVGDRFGLLTVISETPQLVPRRPSGAFKKWLCRCECGAEKYILQGSLRSGKTASCGRCLAGTHRMSGAPEYRHWAAMLDRARHKRAGYEEVAVCPQWESFANFYKDMGPRPSSRHSLDRYPDPYGDYAPGNVRWATPSEQQRNRRDNVSRDEVLARRHA